MVNEMELKLEGYQHRFSHELTTMVTVLYGAAGFGHEDIRNIGIKIHPETKVVSIRTSDGARWEYAWMIQDPRVAVLLPTRHTPTLVKASLERKIEVFSAEDMEEAAKLLLLDRIEETMLRYTQERRCHPAPQEADFSGKGVIYKRLEK